MPAGMTAAALRLRVAPMALLGGRIEARELVVRGMELRLPWPLPPDALALRAPDWLTELSARVEGGRIIVGGVEITGIEASVGTRAGLAWNATGRAVLAGQTVRFALTLTQPGGDNAVGVTLGLEGQGASAELSGQMAAGGDFAGRIALPGGRCPRCLSRRRRGPLRAEGRLTIADGRAAVQAFEGDHAGASLRGAASLRLSPSPRLDLAVTLGRLDLDAWRLALAKPRAAPPLSVGLDLPSNPCAPSAAPCAACGRRLNSAPPASRSPNSRRPCRARRSCAPPDACPGAGHFDGHVALIAPALRGTAAWLAPDLALPPGARRGRASRGVLSLEAGARR
jgi:hypothetical protein